MAKVDQHKMVQAAERVAQRSSTVITEAIEKDEDKNLTLTDRFAAMFAALLVCGACYFFGWFCLLFCVGRFDTGAPLPAAIWFWTWRIPIIATAVTGLSAFVRPGMTYRYFGKLAQRFEKLLTILCSIWY